MLRTGHVIDAIKAGIPNPPSGWIACVATGPNERLAMLMSPRFYAGYQDARAGLATRQEYDGWHPFLQRSYECGRALVACMRGAGFSSPAWSQPYECAINYGPVRDWFEERRRVFPDELLLPLGPEAN